jgi:hypothetical protein
MEDIDPRTLAVITAAVTAHLRGRAFKVRRVRRIRLINRGSSAWRSQGRYYIHTSH